MSTNTLRFLAVVDEDTVMSSAVTSKSIWGLFPDIRRSSVLLRLSFRWWAVVQVLMSARHSEMRVAIRVLSKEGKERNSWLSRSSDRKNVWCDLITEPNDLVYRGSSTEPWGTPVSRGQGLDKEPFHVNWFDGAVRFQLISKLFV